MLQRREKEKEEKASVRFSFAFVRICVSPKSHLRAAQYLNMSGCYIIGIVVCFLNRFLFLKVEKNVSVQ